MKSLSLSLLFSFCALVLQAQVGISARYIWNNAENWSEQDLSGNESLDLLADGYSFGIDYWFRLKNTRIEFLPELNYSQYSQSFPDEREIDARFLSFFFNTNIYLFDMMNDCDCPTFSKQDKLLQKGFFIQVSPGVSYLMNEGTTFNQELESVTFKDNSLAFSIGGAIGIDFGLSDLLTITPMAGIRYFPSATWNNLDTFSENDSNRMIKDTKTSIFQYHAGIRLGMRFDQ